MDNTYTRKERLRNWWDYHRGWVILGAAIFLGFTFLIRDMFFRPKPDYQVAYVSVDQPPASVLARLQEQLEAAGEDVNGDGRVLVELLTYPLGFDAQNMMNVEAATANVTRLTVDLTAGDVYLILLDDPAGFQGRMGFLSYLDGSLPAGDDPTASAGDWQQMVYPWENCPVLAALELGTYTRFLDASERELDGQTALEGIYVGRRAVRDEDPQRFAAAQRLWQRLTENAVPLQ